MTWAQWKAACQLLAEERIGTPRRAAAAAEDAEYDATREAIRRAQQVS